MDQEFAGDGEGAVEAVGQAPAPEDAPVEASVEATVEGPVAEAPRQGSRRLNLVGGTVPKALEPAPSMRGAGGEILSRLDELSRLMLRHDAERAATIEARLESSEAAQDALAARVGSAEAEHEALFARVGSGEAAEAALSRRVGTTEAGQDALVNRIEAAEAAHDGLSRRQETAIETIRGSIDARLAAAAQAQAKALADAEARVAQALAMQGELIEALLAEKARTDTALSLLEGGLAAAQSESEALARRVEERMAAAVTEAEVAAGEAARTLDAPIADVGHRLDAVLFHLETAALDAMPGGARPVRDALRGLAQQIAQVRAEIAALPIRAEAPTASDDEDEAFRQALSGRMDEEAAA